MRMVARVVNSMELNSYRLRVLRAPDEHPKWVWQGVTQVFLFWLGLTKWLVKSRLSLTYMNTAWQRFIPPTCAPKRKAAGSTPVRDVIAEDFWKMETSVFFNYEKKNTRKRSCCSPDEIISSILQQLLFPSFTVVYHHLLLFVLQLDPYHSEVQALHY